MGMSKLFYVIGASGAGKDTLINYARSAINGTEKVIFAHRYITRPANVGNENHIYLSKDEFKERIDSKLFALYWSSHEQFYGIGSEINHWLEQGFNVIVNGSREYLPTARQIYPDMIVVLIEANPKIIMERLYDRGRENAAEIEKRIKRTDEIINDFKGCIKIKNDGAIKDAGDELVNVICLKMKAVF